MTTVTRPVDRPTYRTGTAIAVSAALVALVGSLVNALIALGAVALGAPAEGGLQPMAYITFTVVAAIAGAVGWHIINRYARRPAQVMRWLVPAFLIVSFVPDIPVGLALGWLTAGALMLMHVATIVVAVVVYRRLLPLRAA